MISEGFEIFCSHKMLEWAAGVVKKHLLKFKSVLLGLKGGENTNRIKAVSLYYSSQYKICLRILLLVTVLSALE